MRIAAKRRAAVSMSDYLCEGRRRQVRVAGSRLEVVEVGRGEPIVIAPGLAGGWRLLTPLAKELARRHRVILFGYRDEVDPLSSHSAREVGDHAEDLAGLISELGLELPTVFGVSFGGAVALEMALARPRRIGRLILSGAPSRFESSVGSTVARRVLERFPLPSDNPFVNQFFNILHGGKAEAGPMSRFVVERCWETDQGVMARRLAMLEKFDVSDRLGGLDLPTLVLAGSRDVVVPRARQEALASSIGGAQFEVIEGAGHVGFLTHSAEIRGHVERYIRGASHPVAG